MSTTNPNDSAIRQCSVRIPTAIYKRIERLAKKERRSFNSQTVIVLEQGIDASEKKDGAK